MREGRIEPPQGVGDLDGLDHPQVVAPSDRQLRADVLAAAIDRENAGVVERALVVGAAGVSQMVRDELDGRGPAFEPGGAQTVGDLLADAPRVVFEQSLGG